MGAPDPAPRPPPTSRRVLVAGGAVFAVALAFGAALFSGSIPGLGGPPSSDVQIGGHAYYSEFFDAPFPPWGNNTSAPSSVDFHNVTFWLWVTGWYRPDGTLVHGNGTELDGTTYSFVLGGVSDNGTRSELYLAPDERFAVGWSGEYFVQLEVQLMVEIPTP